MSSARIIYIKNKASAMVSADGMVMNPNLMGTIPMWCAIILPSFIKIGQEMSSVSGHSKLHTKNKAGAMVLANGMVANPNLVSTILK